MKSFKVSLMTTCIILGLSQLVHGASDWTQSVEDKFTNGCVESSVEKAMPEIIRQYEKEYNIKVTKGDIDYKHIQSFLSDKLKTSCECITQKVKFKYGKYSADSFMERPMPEKKLFAQKVWGECYKP